MAPVMNITDMPTGLQDDTDAVNSDDLPTGTVLRTSSVPDVVGLTVATQGRKSYSVHNYTR